MLHSVEINANLRICMISLFGDETRSFRSKVVYSLKMIRFNIYLLIEFGGVQKQKGKIVFSKSGGFHT